MRFSKIGEQKLEKSRNDIFVPAAIFLAFAVFVLAGGPGFFISRIPGYLKDQICLFQNSTPTCRTSKYRTFDGSCNNKDNPLQGTAYSTFTRLLPAQYSDGVAALQKSVTGNELPSPRVISKKVFGEKSVPDPENTIVMMQFGQLVAHDMGFGLDSPGPSCCTGAIGQIVLDVPDCAAIPIPNDDPEYPKNLKCIDFIRNAHSGDLGCPALKPGQAVSQITAVTSHLDLSIIYGNTDEQAKSIRTMSNGKLTTVNRNGNEYPMHNPDATTVCDVDLPTDTCYFAGDERLNQSPHLSILHIMYIREHNRLADALAILNPHWDDEKLFQEARRINIAQYQYVSYYEWLTNILGMQNMIDLKLIYHFSGDEYVNDYNASVMPVIFNEHSNAAFRFFHSQIEGHLNLLTESRDKISTIAMSDHFDSPKFTEENFDDLARGMSYQQAQMADSNFDRELREFLFKHRKEFGQDLRSIDIQRARDHGVARYNDFREFCGLPRATKWDDYLDLIKPKDLSNLQLVYESYEDVELNVGALLEMQTDSTTMAGPTFLCIINIQFHVTRVSDRYWFESGDPEVAFTKPQLAEIRKSTYARIFCDNANNITSIQPSVFKSVKNSNLIVPCTEIPVVDLTKWQELS